MKTLWIETVSEMGGAQCSLLETCRALSKTGKAEVAVLAPRGPLSSLLRESGIAVFPGVAIRGRRSGFGMLSALGRLLRSGVPLGRAIRAFKPDILHANCLTAFLEVMGREHGVPAFWQVRDLRFPIPIARRASHSAAKIIASSKAIEMELANRLSSRVFSRIATVSNGVDIARFKPSDRLAARKCFGLPPGAPVIGMVAHYVAWKRHAAFLDAAALILAKHPDARFVVAGRDLLGESPSLARDLLRRASDLGISERVTWIHNCLNIESLYPAFSVLLHPAINEPFGRAVCEAMACGVPVVAASPGGPDELIDSGANGILVGDGAAEDLADAVLGLLDNPARAEKMGGEAVKTVQAHYSISRVADDLLAVYSKTLDEIRSDEARSRSYDD